MLVTMVERRCPRTVCDRPGSGDERTANRVEYYAREHGACVLVTADFPASGRERFIESEEWGETVGRQFLPEPVERRAARRLLASPAMPGIPMLLFFHFGAGLSLGEGERTCLPRYESARESSDPSPRAIA